MKAINKTKALDPLFEKNGGEAQPYRTTGIIWINECGNIEMINVKGIDIDFKVRKIISWHPSKKEIKESNFDTDNHGNIFFTIDISTEPELS